VPATTVRPRRVLLPSTLEPISRPVYCDRPRKESQQPSCTYILSELLALSNCQVLCPHLASPPGFPRAPTFPPPLIEPTTTPQHYCGSLWTRRERDTVQYQEVRSTSRQQYLQSLHLPATHPDDDDIIDHFSHKHGVHHHLAHRDQRLGISRTDPAFLSCPCASSTTPTLSSESVALSDTALLCSNHPPIDLFCHHQPSHNTSACNTCTTANTCN
jgi:hypothetical protein